MATPLYTLSSLPSTLSTLPYSSSLLKPALPSTQNYQENEEKTSCLSDHEDQESSQPLVEGNITMCKSSLSGLKLSLPSPRARLKKMQTQTVSYSSLPTEGAEENNHSLKAELMFCSPFRRRRKKKVEEQQLSREEAWQLYLAKLEEEANYFTIPEEEEEDICTCHTCIASYEVLYADHLQTSEKPDTDPLSDQGTVFTADIMQSILQWDHKKKCVLM